MTYNREFKRFVRARMETTGETYMQAHAAVQQFLNGDKESSVSKPDEQDSKWLSTPPGPLYRPSSVETSLPHLVPLGVGEDSQEVTWDLLHYPHLQVIGCTGKGKTVVVNNIVAHLLQHPSAFEIITVSRYSRTENSAVMLIEPLESERTIESVYEKFLSQYRSVEAGLNREKSLDPIKWQGKRTVLIIDDEHRLSTSSEFKISEILRKGRAIGMHVIRTYQTPPAPQYSRTDFSIAYVIGKISETASLRALGAASATRIPHRPGAGLVSFGGHEYLIQGYAPPREFPQERLPFL